MFDLVFEHSDFLVINKHPGVSVHKDEQAQSLLDAVGKQTGNSALYLVHRLDKMTSGLLLLAKHAPAAASLSGLFAKREIGKFYLALLSKKPTKKQGSICGDMQKSRRGMWKLLATRTNPAVTQFFTKAADNGYRLAICKPYTGKTHQIRVAMKSIGAPIVGDERYGATLADRGYLHAYALTFCYQDQHFSFLLPPSDGEHWPAVLPLEWQTPSDLPWPKIKRN